MHNEYIIHNELLIQSFQPELLYSFTPFISNANGASLLLTIIDTVEI